MLLNKLLVSKAFCVIFIFHFSATSYAHRSSYGEACNKTTRCDQRSWLSCFSGKCDCIKREEMIFEVTTGKCASKPGERCKYALESSDGIKTLEFTNCVQNSYCGSDGFCSCNDSFFETSYGNCSLSHGYLESCNEEIKCSISSGLECKENVCHCSSNAAAYAPSQRQCVGLPGQKCIDFKCTANAACGREGICLCDEEYFADSDGKCSRRVGFGQKCAADDQCLHEEVHPLKCVEGFCSCDPAISFYGTAQEHELNYGGSHDDGSFNHYSGPSKTQCLGKVNSPCIEKLCVPNAYCSYTLIRRNPYGQKEFSEKCLCRSGSRNTSLGTCGRRHGYSCSLAQCADGLVCNLTASKCSCRYEDQRYSSTEDVCQSKPGGPCGKYMACIPNAECLKFDNSIHGLCSCKEGFITSASRDCELQHGQRCNSSDTCDTVAKLDCIDGACQCRNFGIYSSEHRSCLGFVGSVCNSSAPAEWKCIKNAVCSSSDPRLQSSCTCNPGFVVTTNYTCKFPPENIPVLSLPDYEGETTPAED